MNARSDGVDKQGSKNQGGCFIFLLRNLFSMPITLTQILIRMDARFPLLFDFTFY
jgi:hypothetical protein